MFASYHPAIGVPPCLHIFPLATLLPSAATVDDSLPFILNILLACCASLAGIAVVLCVTQVPMGWCRGDGVL